MVIILSGNGCYLSSNSMLGWHMFGMGSPSACIKAEQCGEMALERRRG